MRQLATTLLASLTPCLVGVALVLAWHDDEPSADISLPREEVLIDGLLAPSPTARGCHVSIGGPHDGLVITPIRRTPDQCNRLRAYALTRGRLVFVETTPQEIQ